MDRHERELAVDARVLEGRLPRARASAPAIAIFFPFSFGPFLGFWTAFDAALADRRCTAIPAGGMSSQQRLAMIDAVGADGRLLHADLRAAAGRGGAEQPSGRRPLAESSVRVLIVAGEPGGSIPATRERIERAGARASSTITA